MKMKLFGFNQLRGSQPLAPHLHPCFGAEVFDSMLEFNRLRIEKGNGPTATEYRIEGGCVESRMIQSGAAERPWRRLTPEKLRSHVMAGTLLSRWLRRRMGVHQLIRACQQDSSFVEHRNPTTETAPTKEYPRAA